MTSYHYGLLIAIMSKSGILIEDADEVMRLMAPSPLPEPMQTYHQFTKEHSLIKFYPKSFSFHFLPKIIFIEENIFEIFTCQTFSSCLSMLTTTGKEEPLGRANCLQETVAFPLTMAFITTMPEQCHSKPTTMVQSCYPLIYKNTPLDKVNTQLSHLNFHQNYLQ